MAKIAETASDSASERTNGAVRKVEAELIAAIAACEEDIRLAVENLARLKEALRLLRTQRPISQLTKQTTLRGETSRRSVSRRSISRINRERKGSAASIIRSFVRRELREAGHPLTRSEILERMTRAGIEIDAKVPLKRIAKVMWSSNEFVNVGDGYWFAGEPIPEPENGRAGRPVDR